MIAIAYPLVLWVLLPLVLLFLFMILSNKDKVARVFEDEALIKVQSSQAVVSKRTRDILLAVALIVMVVALSRPLLVKDHQRFAPQKSVLIAFDISHSMFTQDIFPNRVEFAKQKMIDLLRQAQGVNFSLALFNDETFLVSPATNNYSVLIEKLSHLEIAWNDRSSDFMQLFEKSSHFFGAKESEIVLIVSDGDSQGDYDVLQKAAKSQEIEIIVTTVGTSRGAPLVDMDANPIRGEWSRMNPEISRLSNFSMIELEKSDAIGNILNQIDAIKSNQALHSYDNYDKIELFKPLLGVALVALFISFFSLPRGVKMIVVMAALYYPTSGYAFDHFNIKKAQQAYQNQEYEEAIKYFNLLRQTSQTQYNIANSYYNLGEYEKAIEYYNEVDTQNIELAHKKYHNLGNSYFNLESYEEAIKHYQKVLKFKEDEQSLHNLELAKQKLKEQEEDATSNEGTTQKQQQTQNGNRDEQMQNGKDESLTQDLQMNKEQSQEQSIKDRYRKYDRMLYRPKTQIIKIED